MLNNKYIYFPCMLLAPVVGTFGALLSRLGRFFLPENLANIRKQGGLKMLANNLLNIS